MAVDTSNQAPRGGSYLLPCFSPGFLSNASAALAVFGPLDRALERFRAMTDTLKAAHNVATAVGGDLDDLGALVGLPRLSGEPDSLYRLRIPATVQHGVSSTNNQDMQAALSAGQGVPVTAVDYGPGLLGFAVTVLGNTATLASVPDQVRQMKAAGIPFSVRALVGGGSAARVGLVRVGGAEARIGGRSGYITLT